MTDTTTISPMQIADILIAGERDRREVPQISETYGDVDMVSAYAAQQTFVQSGLR